MLSMMSRCVGLTNDGDDDDKVMECCAYSSRQAVYFEFI